MKSGYDYNSTVILPLLTVLAVKRGRKGTAKCLTTKESLESMIEALDLDFVYRHTYKERTPFATDLKTRRVYYTQAVCRQYGIQFADSYLTAMWNPITRECVVTVDFCDEVWMKGFKFTRTK